MQRWERVYEFTGPGRLAVDQGEGDLRVVGWERPAVLVKASWPGEGPVEDRLEVEVQPNGLALNVKPYRSGFLGIRSYSRVDLEIFVPRGTLCHLESGSGSVTVDSTRGPVTVDGGSGPVQVRQGAGTVHVETGSGSITVADLEGGCYLESSSGAIQVSRVASHEMRVETGSGGIRAEGLNAKRLFVETGSGSVEAELVRIHPDGDYQFETGSGRVFVAVPADAGFRLEIDSRGGVDYGGLPVRILSHEDDEVKAIVGAGGPTFSIENGSGSITLRPSHGPALAPAPANTEAETARILKMVQVGKLSVQEAEELLRALDGEGGQP